VSSSKRLLLLGKSFLLAAVTGLVGWLSRVFAREHTQTDQSDSDLAPIAQVAEPVRLTLYLILLSIFPKKVELQALMRHYDVDGDGNIGYEEFIRGLR